MTILSRRSFLSSAACAGALAGTAPALLSRRAKAAGTSLTLSGMPAAPSTILAYIVEEGLLRDQVDDVSFTIWRTPDQMRAGAVSGSMDVFATPSYACANMRNRGVPVRMLNIMTWGLLYVMSTDESVKTVADLAGRDVVLAFKNDAPDLIFRMTARKSGMDPLKDINVTYVGTPMEAVQMLVSGRASIAILPEAAATAAQMRGRMNSVAVHRSIDLTAAYADLTGRPPRIAQAGMAVQEDLVQKRPELVAAVHRACQEGGAWVANNPASAGRLGADYLKVKAPIVERSIPYFRLNVTSAAEARADMEAYFQDLMEMSPDILGGRMPDDAFYWGA